MSDCNCSAYVLDECWLEEDGTNTITLTCSDCGVEKKATGCYPIDMKFSTDPVVEEMLAGGVTFSAERIDES